MKVLDLFSGIGGFSVGLERAGWETISFCEIEDYPRKVLAKHWPNVPIASDVTKLTYQEGVLYDDGEEIYRGPIDAICGGFPCQDISLAGKQAGIEEGTRSGLWSECARLLREVRPDYAIFENVTALLSGQQGRWFQRVLFDISEVGYDAEWHCISASELGAHHHRDRVWIIAYSDSANSGNEREAMVQKNELVDRGQAKPNNYGESGYVADSCWQRLERDPETRNSKEKRSWLYEQLKRCLNHNKPKAWAIEPDVGRVANGVPDRSHRLKCLGNAVVPQIPELIGRAINER